MRLGLWGIAVGGLLSTACVSAWEGVRGDGMVREERRPVSGFQGVSLCCGFDGLIQVGPEPKLTLVADANLLPLIRSEVRAGVLEIDVPGPKVLRPSRPVYVHVQTPELSQVQVSGGGKVRVEAASARAWEVGASGGSSVLVENLRSEELELSASGGSDLTVRGEATRLRVDLSGGSELKGRSLKVTHAEVDGSGGSEAELEVTDEVTGSVSGGSTLRLKGHPRRHQVDQSGGSDVLYDR